MDPPDFLFVGQGSADTSKKIKKTVETFRFNLEEGPVETPIAVGVVEKCHRSLRMAYKRIKADSDRQRSDNRCL